MGECRLYRQNMYCPTAGAMLERATGGAIPAVEHRVVRVNNNNDNAEKEGRIVAVWKLKARPTTVLNPLAWANDIKLEMPLLAGEGRKAISVVDFEKWFAETHPSIYEIDNIFLSRFLH